METLKEHKLIPLSIILVVVLALIIFFAGGKANAPIVSEQIDQNMSKLQITDNVVGEGIEAKTGDRVFVNYTGRFVDGKLFDTSLEEVAKAEGVYTPLRDYDNFDFILGAGDVIKGWDEGVVGMKEGGKRTLVIPPELAYGMADYGPIPGGSTLVFEVELVKVAEKTPDLP